MAPSIWNNIRFLPAYPQTGGIKNKSEGSFSFGFISSLLSRRPKKQSLVYSRYHLTLVIDYLQVLSIRCVAEKRKNEQHKYRDEEKRNNANEPPAGKE